MYVMENIIQRHTREMKALRRSLSSTSKRLDDQLRKSDMAVADLKRRIAEIPLTVQEPKTPLHMRILSFIF